MYARSDENDWDDMREEGKEEEETTGGRLGMDAGHWGGCGAFRRCSRRASEAVPGGWL